VAAHESALLRARGHLARGEHAAARAVLGAEAAWAPQAVLPRLLLSRALLGEGDLAGAEEALRAVLRLAPGHPEAGRELASLLGRQGRAPAAGGAGPAAAPSQPGP
jgi:hypothetical protein